MKKTKSFEIVRGVIGLGLVLAAFSGSAGAVDLPAPEIDPGSIGSAMALLSGGLMLLTNRRRSK